MAVTFIAPGPRPGPETIMAERRGMPRQKSFLRGCIYFNNRRSVLDCLIRDLTEDGARIIFSHTVNVPDVVELYIPQREQTVRAHVKWRRGDDIGLDFANRSAAASAPAPAPSAAPQDAELGKRVAQLEADVTALKRTVRQLKRELPNGNDAEVA
jgi:PilZ domain